MSKRSGTETVGRIFLAFLEKTSWSQAKLASKVEVSVRVVRSCLEELERGGMSIEREDDPPQVIWSVPNGWYPDGLTLARADASHVVRFIARSPKSVARDALLRPVLPAPMPSGVEHKHTGVRDVSARTDSSRAQKSLDDRRLHARVACAACKDNQPARSAPFSETGLVPPYRVNTSTLLRK